MQGSCPCSLTMFDEYLNMIFFRSWTSSGGSGSFTCAGKPHSWWKWMEKLFICLTLFDNWLDSWTWLFWCDSFKLATQDFVTTCYQLLPTHHWQIWLIWLIWQYHWSTASVHSENPSPRAARACDRSDGLLGLTLGTSATSACDTRCFVLQVLDLDFQGHFNLNIHVETYQLSPKVCLQVLQDMKSNNMICK